MQTAYASRLCMYYVSMMSIVQVQYVWNTFTRLKRLSEVLAGPRHLLCRLRGVHVSPTRASFCSRGRMPSRDVLYARLDPCI